MILKAAVVGWPIEHSLSPVLHGHWLKQYGIDGSYEKIAIVPGTFAQRIAELREAGYRGVNVTVPYKEEAFALASSNGSASVYDKASRITGASNVLAFNNPHPIEARNTDGIGLVNSLQESLGFQLQGKSVVVLGAGGAARGVVYSLANLGAAIHVLNRDKNRAFLLAENIRGFANSSLIHGGALSDWKTQAEKAQLVINATSAGMGSNPPLDIDLDVLPKTATVCDIVYSPLETPLLKDAVARGLKTIDGLGMLMHQAVPSFKAFFGIEPEVTPGLRAALVEALNAR